MLKGKNIFLTGGTGTLGEALTRYTLSQGASVCFTYSANESKARELESLGAKPFLCDFRSPQAIRQLTNGLSNAGLAFHALIHNAAIVRDRTLQNLTEESWDEVIQVNLKAPIQLTEEFIPLLRASAQAPAKIFTVVSRVGLMGGFGAANYAASKDGLIEWTQYLAHRLGPEKVLVNAINPGFMISGMTQDLPEKILEKQKQTSLLEQFSNPVEVAAWIGYLLSDHCTRLTGQVFHYDSRSITL